MKEGPDISRVAALIGNPACANMLMALMPGPALTVTELVVLSLSLALPPAMILPEAAAFPVSMPVLVALVAVIVRRDARSRPCRRTTPIPA